MIIPSTDVRGATLHVMLVTSRGVYYTSFKLPDRQTRLTAIGATLKRLRVSQKMSALDVAMHLHISTDKIYAVEQGDEQNGFLFQNYVSYAAVFHLSLREILLYAHSSNMSPI